MDLEKLIFNHNNNSWKKSQHKKIAIYTILTSAIIGIESDIANWHKKDIILKHSKMIIFINQPHQII